VFTVLIAIDNFIGVLGAAVGCGPGVGSCDVVTACCDVLIGGCEVVGTTCDVLAEVCVVLGVLVELQDIGNIRAIINTINRPE